MSLHRTVYRHLPGVFQTWVRSGYYRISDDTPLAEFREQFVDDCFQSSETYDRYANEFIRGSSDILREAAPDEFDSVYDGYGVGQTIARDYYAIVRASKPETVVETGVCNGVSTLAILLALDKNESGRLHSIDYPFRADESLKEFRDETFKEYGGAAIPADKDPGWIIPDRLHDRWNLTIGKSQRELPSLLREVGPVEMFHHDSEHSHPCQMFELEIAYEWLSDGGIIVCDDIRWSEAFEIFTDVRELQSGKVSHGTGYIKC